MVPSGDSIERQAVRILFILYFCRDQTADQGLQLRMFEKDYRAYSIDSETKLQKIEFWVRYPDHLASAFLRECEAGVFSGDEAQEIKQVIRQIFRDDEPSLRQIPMSKYLRGAYEPLDEVMSFLHSRRLASRRIIGESRYRIQYFLTPKGVQAVTDLLQNCPQSHWYADRCKLINRFFGRLKGYEIRDLQYLEEKYAFAPRLQKIAGIKAEVQQDFERIFGEPL